jgi:hypothetical protein
MIGMNVSIKTINAIKQKIIAGQYVDLLSLLFRYECRIGSNLKKVKKNKKKNLTR